MSHQMGTLPWEGSLQLLQCQGKEHSMRIKRDPSTILSIGKQMDAIHKHRCSQFNSQGRMWIILDLIQAGYRGRLHGRPHILKIPTSKWNYGETQNLPCKIEQRKNVDLPSQVSNTIRSTVFIMHIRVKKKIKYPKWQESKDQDQIRLDLLPFPSKQLLARMENLIEWDQLCYFSLKSTDEAYACR